MPENVDVSEREVEALGDEARRQALEEAGAERLVVALAIGGGVAEVADGVDALTYTVVYRLSIMQVINSCSASRSARGGARDGRTYPSFSVVAECRPGVLITSIVRSRPART